MLVKVVRRKDGFGRNVVLLIVQTVHAAKVGDAALGRYSRAPEKYDSIRRRQPLFVFLNLHIRTSPFVFIIVSAKESFSGSVNSLFNIDMLCCNLTKIQFGYRIDYSK